MSLSTKSQNNGELCSFDACYANLNKLLGNVCHFYCSLHGAKIDMNTFIHTYRVV